MEEMNQPEAGVPEMAADDPTLNPVQIAGIDPENPVSGELAQEALVKKLMDKFDKWEEWRKPFESTWDEIFGLYMSQSGAKKTPSRSRIFIPIVFQVVESAVAKFMGIMFGQEGYFDVIPDTAKDEPIAKVIKKLIGYQLGRAKVVIKFVDFLKQLLLYGTSYLYVYWKVDRKWVWTRKPVRQEMSIMGFPLGSKIVGWEETKEYKVVERRPEVEVLDIRNVYPDPSANMQDQGEGVFVRTWIDKDYLKEMGQGQYKIYANTEDPKLLDKQSSDRSSIQSTYSARGVNDPQQQSKNMVEVLTYWGCMDIDGDGIREEVQIVLGNRQVLLRAIGNPFYHQKRPVLTGTLFPIPHQWYGMGMIEPIVPLQHELNTLRRQRLDNVNLILNRMWMVNSNADVDIDTLISAPNAIVLTDDMTAVAALPTPDATQSSYEEAQVVQGDIENVTTPRSVQGIPESGRLGRTAKGAQLIIGQALEKFGSAARLLEEGPIKEMLKMFHQLNLQFIDSEDVAREIGMTGSIFDQTIDPDMIRADVSFKMVGISDMVDKESKINQLINFFSVFAQILTPEAHTKIAQRTYSLMGFDPDLDTIAGMLPMPGAMATSGSNPDNAAAAAQGQVMRNGAAAPPSMPGMPPPMAQ